MVRNLGRFVQLYYEARDSFVIQLYEIYVNVT